MNTEKQITITDLRGKFTKDFDTFGKMDPFVEFNVGKCSGRTETSKGAGKEPTWKNSVVLTYFDETTISIKAYDEDATENEYIGSGKIEIKTLRFPGGAIEVNICTQSGENIGVVNGKYTIKNLNPTPLILLKNIRCNFVKQHDFILKSKPFMQFSTDDGSVSSETKEEGVVGFTISWNDGLRLRIKENGKFFISLIDKNDPNSFIFKYESHAKQFRSQSGTKKFNVFDKNYFYLGVVEFDFETVNLVSKEESVKNADRDKKIDSQLTSIGIERVKTELEDAQKNIYYNFIVGTNKIETDVVKSVPKSSSLDVKKVIYADSRENKLMILIWEKNLLKDKVIAVAYIPLEGLASGQKKAALLDSENKEAGSITLTLNIKQVPAKVINFENIAVQFIEGSDMIGESQPYIVLRIGGASNRTETGDKNKYQYKRGIQLKYNDEDTLDIEVWDEDLTNDEIIYADKLKLSELKGSKGQFSTKVKMKEESKILDKAKITFKYEIKVNAPPPEVKKASEKKVDAPLPPPPPEVKPEPKVEEKTVEVKPEPKVQPKKEVVPEVKPQPKVEEKQKQQTPRITEQEMKPQLKVESPRKSINDLTQKHKTIDQPQQSVRVKEINKTEESKAQNSRMRSVNRESRKKQSLFPSIGSSHLNYGDKIFDKQSAATLQKSIVAYSMPKAHRFTNEPKYSGQPTYCIDSCFKSSSMKGVGFGFGKKKQFPDWVERNMKENPPPGAYIDVNSDTRPKGPTFGIAHKYYEKVMIPKEKASIHPTHRKLSPITGRHK